MIDLIQFLFHNIVESLGFLYHPDLIYLFHSVSPTYVQYSTLTYSKRRSANLSLFLFFFSFPVQVFLLSFSLSTCCRVKVKEFRDKEMWSFTERPRGGVSSFAPSPPTPLKCTSTIDLPSTYFKRDGHCSLSIHPLPPSLSHTHTLANGFVTTFDN